MKKCIYKVTNLINGKIYVGQTNDYKRRVREHKKKMYGNTEKMLYDAFEKYGIENFSFELIEDYCEDYNKKENEWIEKLNCLTPNGYNIDLNNLEFSNNHFLLDSEIQSIINDLQNTNLTFDEIAEKYNIKTAQTIRDINQGKTHKQFNLFYPIRKQRNEKARERALLIIQDLKETNLKMEEIAKKYNCSPTTVSNINTGTRVRFENENYPIRKNTRKGQKFSQETVQCIYKDILETDLTWEELAEKYQCGTKVFQHINQGKTNIIEGYIYPLRQGQKKKGEDNVSIIINLLKTTNLTYTEIANQLSTNRVTVANIDKGLTHKREEESYPIRKK